jgi:peptide/nickel transport system substrate-binding protein
VAPSAAGLSRRPSRAHGNFPEVVVTTIPRRRHSSALGSGRTRRRSWVGVALAAVLACGLPLALASPAGADTASPSGSSSASASASASASSSGPAGASGNKLTFTVGILHDVDSLNPFTGIVTEAYEAYQVMYDYLSQYSAGDFKPADQLATAVSPSADGKTWTYTIRTGVTWSDGQPLTAKDVAYTIDRIIKGTYEQTNWGNYVANIQTVTAPNDTTVVMTTKAPTPVMTHLTLPILPQHVWSKIDENAVKSYANDTGAVGSGPFVLAERKVGQYTRFVANKHYWGGAPKIDELVYRVYANPDAMAQALKKGEIDYADGLKASVWNGLKNTNGITSYAAVFTGFDELGFNTGAALTDGTPIGTGHPALKDVKVRQALNYAIDREALVKRTLDGHGSVGSTIIPPIYPALHQDPPNPYTFELAKANSLLDAAGYAKGADGVRRMPGGGKPLVFRMFARQPSQESQQSAKFIQGWFKQIGITVDVSVLAEDNLTEKLGQGDYDLFEWGWVVEPDPDYQLSVMTCGKRSYKDSGEVIANLSDSFYCNPAYDALYTQQATQIDATERAATVKKAEQLLYDEAPYAVLYYYDDLVAYNSKWTGFVKQPSDRGMLLFQYGAWSYPHLEVASTAAKEGGGSTAAGGSSSNTGLLVGGGVVVALALVGGGVALSRRRRADASDVE